MGIGQNIRRLREQRNMSQQDLADVAGVSNKAVSTWENEYKTPRMGAIEKMAAFFGVPKSAIIDENESVMAPLPTNAPESQIPEDKITIFSRNARKLSPEEWEQLQSVARVLFKKVFDEDKDE